MRYIIPFFALTLAACDAPDDDAFESTSADVVPSLQAPPVRFEPAFERPGGVRDLTHAFAAPRTSCTVDRVPRVTTVVSHRPAESARIEVIIEGEACGSAVVGFSFDVYDGHGNDVTGRSWPEVDEVVVHEDGRFTIRGAAAGCGDYSDVVSIELVVSGEDGDSDPARGAVEVR